MADDNSTQQTPAVSANPEPESYLHSIATSLGIDPEAVKDTARAVLAHPHDALHEISDEAATELENAATHPLDTLKQAATGVVDQITNPEAAKVARARYNLPGVGNKAAGVAEAIGSAVPLIGGNIVKSQEQAVRGNLPGAAGTLTGTLAPAVLEEGARQAPEAIHEAGAAARENMAAQHEASLQEARTGKVVDMPGAPKELTEGQKALPAAPHITFEEAGGAEVAPPRDAETSVRVADLKRMVDSPNSIESKNAQALLKESYGIDAKPGIGATVSPEEASRPLDTSNLGQGLSETERAMRIEDLQQLAKSQNPREASAAQKILQTHYGVGAEEPATVEVSPVVKSTITPSDRDYEDYFERQDNTASHVLNEYDNALDKPGYRQQWDLVPAGRLTKIWNDYAKSGIVRDEKGVNQIADTIQQNIHKIEINNILTGHSQQNPAEYAEGLTGNRPADDHFEKNENFFDDEKGSWRISDYAEKQLSNLSMQLDQAKTAEQKVGIIDQILNTVHQRGDLASWFVEGGTKTLSKLSERDVPPVSHPVEPQFKQTLASRGQLPGQTVNLSPAGSTYVGHQLEAKRAMTADSLQQSYNDSLGTTTGSDLLPVPKRMLDPGQTPEAGIAHEVFHALELDRVGAKWGTGIENHPLDIMSHFNSALDGATMGVTMPWEKVPGAELQPNGFYSFKGPALREIVPDLLSILMAGGEGANLSHGTPAEAGMVGDNAEASKLMRAAGFTPNEAKDLTAKTKENLRQQWNNPDILNLVRGAAAGREEGLSKTLHMSSERLQNIRDRVRQIRQEAPSGQETSNTPASAGASSAISATTGEPGGAGLSTEGNLREGNGEAVSPVAESRGKQAVTQNPPIGYIRPDGQFEQFNGSSKLIKNAGYEATHEDFAANRDTDQDALQKEGWVRKAGLGSYDAGHLTPQTTKAIENDLIHDYADIKKANRTNQSFSIVLETADGTFDIPVDDFIEKYNGDLGKAMRAVKPTGVSQTIKTGPRTVPKLTKQEMLELAPSEHLELAPGENLADIAVKKYGVTDNPTKMGFILPDGRGLDFSEGRPARTLDHGDVSSILPRKGDNAVAYNENPREVFADRTGAARILISRDGVNIVLPESGMTPEQNDVILRAAEKHPGDVTIDIRVKGKIGSASGSVTDADSLDRLVRDAKKDARTPGAGTVSVRPTLESKAVGGIAPEDQKRIQKLSVDERGRTEKGMIDQKGKVVIAPTDHDEIAQNGFGAESADDLLNKGGVRFASYGPTGYVEVKSKNPQTIHHAVQVIQNLPNTHVEFDFHNGVDEPFYTHGEIHKVEGKIQQWANEGTVSMRPNLETKPAETEPNTAIQESAQKYAAAQGMPEIKHIPVIQDLDRARAIAQQYEAAKHNPNDPQVKAAYDALKSETKAQFHHLRDDLGLKFEPTDKDPYVSAQAMMHDIRQNNRLKVFTGSSTGADHPLSEIDPETGESYNTLFRWVHDAYGHAAGGNDFSENGEKSATEAHAQMYSPAARPAMRAETEGQTSHFFHNPAVESGAKQPGEFAPQKATLIPDWNETAGARAAKEPAGGINPRTGQEDKTGLGVEIYPELRQPLDHAPTSADFQKFYEQHKGLFDQNPELRVGWDNDSHGPGGHEINIGAVGPGAVKVAGKLDQYAAYDIAKGKNIDAGGTGKQTQFPDYPLEDRLKDLRTEPESFEPGKVLQSKPELFSALDTAARKKLATGSAGGAPPSGQKDTEVGDRIGQCIGNCKNESLIDDIFGSVSEFARQVEENGDNFTYRGVQVRYNPKTDTHSFYEAPEAGDTSFDFGANVKSKSQKLKRGISGLGKK